MSIADKLTTIAENVPKVYEAGQKSEYDRFWDAFQQNGNRTDYTYAFRGYNLYNCGWCEATFKPKYDLKITNGAYMFAQQKSIANLTQLLNKQGVKLDTSNATDLSYLFWASTSITHVPEINISSVKNSTETSQIGLSYLFGGMNGCKTIEKLKMLDEGQFFPDSAFNTLNNLENIVIEGKFAGSINFSWSTLLTHDSLMSIINALKDYSEDTSGKTYTLTLGSTNLAKLTDAEKAIATEKGWTLA